MWSTGRNVIPSRSRKFMSWWLDDCQTSREAICTLSSLTTKCNTDHSQFTRGQVKEQFFEIRLLLMALLVRPTVCAQDLDNGAGQSRQSQSQSACIRLTSERFDLRDPMHHAERVPKWEMTLQHNYQIWYYNSQKLQTPRPRKCVPRVASPSMFMSHSIVPAISCDVTDVAAWNGWTAKHSAEGVDHKYPPFMGGAPGTFWNTLTVNCTVNRRAAMHTREPHVFIYGITTQNFTGSIGRQ